MLTGLAEQPRPTQAVMAVLEQTEQAFDYLKGHLEPLTDPLRTTGRTDIDQATAAVLRVLGAADLDQVVAHHQVAGDLLGAVHTLTMGPSERSGRGAFYTPPALAHLMACLVDVGPGESFNDPCAGCGGLAIATIRRMRTQGQSPELVHWVLGDLDAAALACAGVQLAAMGMPVVTLRPGDALTSG